MRSRLLVVAAAAGLLHAAVSLMWALGGTWLLPTVGEWAVEWSRESPGQARAALLVITLGKAGLALGPLVLGVRRRALRVLWWTAGAGFAAYGALNTTGAWLVLAGVVGDRDDDPAALWGHAALWDPLFLIWGLALLAGLRATVSRAPS